MQDTVHFFIAPPQVLPCLNPGSFLLTLDHADGRNNTRPRRGTSEDNQRRWAEEAMSRSRSPNLRLCAPSPYRHLPSAIIVVPGIPETHTRSEGRKRLHDKYWSHHWTRGAGFARQSNRRSGSSTGKRHLWTSHRPQ